MVHLQVCSEHVKLRAFSIDSINPIPRPSTERRLLFSHIYRMHFDYVQRLLKRFRVPCRDSEDLAHDVFFAVWHQFDKYDESRPIKPWLYVFVAHRARNYHALVCHSRVALTANVPNVIDDVPSADEMMAAAED